MTRTRTGPPRRRDAAPAAPADGAKAAALGMLARRPLSEGEIRERLAARGFAGEAIAAALGRLRELGLVDDRELCAGLVRSWRAGRRYGPRRIAAALLVRRFAPDLVAEVLRESASPEEEQAAAAALLRKKFPGGVPPGRAGAAKAYRFLVGRGYGPEVCRQAIRGAFVDIEEGEG